MSYLVLARKYRPQTFADVVQQDHVTRTLANAIETGRMAHAVLFAGPRGTGKTTVARILAKAMNCETGPTPTPCNTCRSCTDITAGHAADVFEIDGASNNSVDQVRELRENLKYVPVHSKYKIYIIDEVHMLSLAAFNALLKTLEEPPAHILFMFATTEVHKIPITILSRCQRHDLRRIDANEIALHLGGLCKQEGVAIDNDSLALIARESGGSMRDGLSLLDHILACAQGPVTVKLICDLLGIVERRNLFDMAKAVLSGDEKLVLQQIDTVWRQGYEIKRYYADLVALFHCLTIMKVSGASEGLVDLPDYEIDQLRHMVGPFSDNHVLHFFDCLFQAEPTVKLSSQPRYALEIVLLRLLQQALPLPIDTLIEHLDKLRQDVLTQPIQIQSSVSAPPKDASPPETGAAAGPSAGTAAAKIPLPDSDNSSSAGFRPFMQKDRLWLSMMDRIQEQKPSLSAFLGKCDLKTIIDNVLEIEVNGNTFTFKRIKKHLPFLETVGSDLAGQPIQIHLISNVEDSAAKQKEKDKEEQLKNEALGHPMVMEALALFDGKVVDVKKTP